MAVLFNASHGAVREDFSRREQPEIIDVQSGGARLSALDCASISFLGPFTANYAAADPVLLRQFLQTFGSLITNNSRKFLAWADFDQMNRNREMVVNLNMDARRIPR